MWAVWAHHDHNGSTGNRGRMLTHLLQVHLLPVYAFEELVLLHFGGSASEEHRRGIFNDVVSTHVH